LAISNNCELIIDYLGANLADKKINSASTCSKIKYSDRNINNMNSEDDTIE